MFVDPAMFCLVSCLDISLRFYFSLKSRLKPRYPRLQIQRCIIIYFTKILNPFCVEKEGCCCYFRLFGLWCYHNSYAYSVTAVTDSVVPINGRTFNRVRPRFFDQDGHETMYASSGNKQFFH